MTQISPVLDKVRVSHAAGPWTNQNLKSLDHVIVVAPARPAKAVWLKIPGGKGLQSLSRRMGAAGQATVVRWRIAGGATGMTFGRLADSTLDSASNYELLRFAGKLAEDAHSERPRSLGLIATGFDADEENRILRAIALAAGAWSFDMPDFRTGRKDASRLRTLRIFGGGSSLGLERIEAEIQANNLARWLSALPANELTAATYRTFAAEMARGQRWKMTFLDTRQLRRLGAGAFLAVAQGNASPDAGVVHLKYRPGASDARPDIALVGKGIIFDTGGSNLKPFKAMLDMHGDMGGSAVALASLFALARLEVPLAVDCWLALSENRIGPESYKSRDVVTAANGTTIEVIHTDAEGRMVLADTLVLAGREEPRLVIDFATLTGACVGAVSERYCGAFTNRAALNDTLIAAGKSSGERTWPFPMDDDFADDLISQVADIRQCAVDARSDHILAAKFLSRFVDDAIPWIHLDLAGSERTQPLGQVPAGMTGLGVRLALALLLDHADRMGIEGISAAARG